MDGRINYHLVSLRMNDSETVEGDRIREQEISRETSAGQMSNQGRTMEQLMKPPSYDIAMQLPTYEEYEQIKRREEEDSDQTHADDSQSSEASESTSLNRNVDALIGTDNMFIIGFVLSFLFNWIGLLISFCLMRALAGRYGALAGFGLSIVKWVLIMKSNDWMTGMSQDTLVWWIMMIFGVLLSCSGCLQYLSIKYKLKRRGGTFII